MCASLQRVTFCRSVFTACMLVLPVRITGAARCFAGSTHTAYPSLLDSAPGKFDCARMTTRTAARAHDPGQLHEPCRIFIGGGIRISGISGPGCDPNDGPADAVV